MNTRKIGLLDEIEDLPLTMQAKLLRALQEQEIIRVGGNEIVKIDIRIIATSNKDLKKMVEDGLFRRDFYYRLNVVSINIPPLRERREDIVALAGTFLNRANEKLPVRTSKWPLTGTVCRRLRKCRIYRI